MSLLSPIVKKITIEVILNNDAIDDAIRYLVYLKSSFVSYNLDAVSVPHSFPDISNINNNHKVPVVTPVVTPKVEIKTDKNKSLPKARINNVNVEVINKFIIEYCTFDSSGYISVNDLRDKFNGVTKLNLDKLALGKLMTCWMGQHPEKSVVRSRKGSSSMGNAIRCYQGIKFRVEETSIINNTEIEQGQDQLLDSITTTEEEIEDLEFSLQQFYELVKTNKYDALRCIKDYDKHYVELKSRGIDITEYVVPDDLYRIMEDTV